MADLNNLILWPASTVGSMLINYGVDSDVVANLTDEQKLDIQNRLVNSGHYSTTSSGRFQGFIEPGQSADLEFINFTITQVSTPTVENQPNIERIQALVQEDSKIQTRQNGAVSSEETRLIEQLNTPNLDYPRVASETELLKSDLDPNEEIIKNYIQRKEDELERDRNSRVARDGRMSGSISEFSPPPTPDIWFRSKYNQKFSITDLKNKITGLNQLSKFYFDFIEIRTGTIDPESNLRDLIKKEGEYWNVLKNLYFYSENITIPMRGINTDPHTYANGFRFEAPVSSNYGDGDIAITMIVDLDYKIYDFFMKWMNSIHDKKTGYFSFHNRYTTNLDIYQLNNIGVEFSKYTTFEDMVQNPNKKFFNYQVALRNCYPKSVSAIEFKHESRDERVKITVNFTYEQVYYNQDFN